MKKVTAIITTHNRCDLLKRAIESVLNQTYKNLECIVVDDNSTDKTREICSMYPVNYVHIPKEESRGGNYARNLGAKVAQGEYIAYLDDDDWWMSSKIETQILLAEEKDAGIIYCLREWHKPNIDIIGYESMSYAREGNLSNKIYRHYITSTSCLLINRDLFFKVGGFDEKLKKWQEYELLMRLCQFSEVYLVHQFLVGYWIDDNDNKKLTNVYSIVKESILYIYKKHTDSIKKNKWTLFCFLDMSVCELYNAAKRAGDVKTYVICFLWAVPSIFAHRIIVKTKKYLS